MYSGKVSQSKIIFALEDGSFPERTKNNTDKYFDFEMQEKGP
jgi:hypothetical protein